MEYFRSLTDYKLMPNSYVIVMLDEKRFKQNPRKEPVRKERPAGEKVSKPRNENGEEADEMQSDEIAENRSAEWNKLTTWIFANEAAEFAYMQLIKAGCKPQEALILPMLGNSATRVGFLFSSR